MSPAQAPSKVSHVQASVSCPMEQGVVIPESAKSPAPHSPVKANVVISGRIGLVSPVKAGNVSATPTARDSPLKPAVVMTEGLIPVDLVGRMGVLKEGVMEPVLSMSKSPLAKASPGLSNTFAILDSTCPMDCGIVDEVLSSQEDGSSSSAKAPVVKQPKGKGKGSKGSGGRSPGKKGKK